MALKLHFVTIVMCLCCLFSTASETTLEEDFINPPVTARPYVWWHWMGSNFSKEGITKDLEAMKAAGIGGATIFNLASAVQETHAPIENNPWPDRTYRSPAYWDALKHAAAEAQRLDLEIGLHNTVGYSTTGGPWIDQQRGMQKVVWTSFEAEGGKELNLELPQPQKTSYSGWGNVGQTFDFYRDIGIIAMPAGDGLISQNQVIELTDKFKNGRLIWTVPQGQWKIIRFGYAPTGANPHPIPDELIGKTLETDKISAEQTRYHWAQVIDPIKEHLGGYLGKSFRHFLIDSYEAGEQNWTPGFRETFKRIKGYDPLVWMASLPSVITWDKNAKEHRIIGSEEQTNRFEWDYRDVIEQLYYENGWKIGADAVHAVGCQLQFEPYGGPFDTVSGSALADLPMGEFWTGGKGDINGNIVSAGRGAGRNVIGAEALTGRPEVSKWTETPAFLKITADGAYGIGVNRLILHHWVHQPFGDTYQPGMGMGWWGTHFSRNQTWLEPGKAFFLYLGRVQAMLQRGETPSDFISVQSQQGGDVMSWRAFRESVQVKDGKIVMPGGRTYPFLSIPHTGAMLPSDVRRVGELLTQGAVIVCKRPSKSPSLTGYPKCDQEVAGLADKIWSTDNENVRKVGKGKLYANGDFDTARRDFGITPFFEVLKPAPRDIRIQYRHDSQADIFFVANVNDKPNAFTVSFRVSGKRPELWNAETGQMMPAGIWREKEGRTEVDFRLDAAKTIFAVFRDKTLPADHVSGIAFASDNTKDTPGYAFDIQGMPDGGVRLFSEEPLSGKLTFASGRTQDFLIKEPEVIALKGPWKAELKSPVDNPPSIQMDFLHSLTEDSNPSVKYFSGTAAYRTTAEVPALAPGMLVILDIGDVRDLATVAINGQKIGVLWHPPYRIDVTKALKAGTNQIEIAVANTWHNRLVGDEQEPADFEWGNDRGANLGRAMKAFPDWFVKDQPRPSKGRKGFVIWYYHRQDTPLIPSGLLGPVELKLQNSQTIQPQ